MPITTDIDRFRLELGDTPAAYGLTPDQVAEFEAAALFNDDEIAYFLATNPTSVLSAVAAACDSLAARFAQEVDEAEDGQSFKLSQKATMYRKLADAFRARAATEIAAAQTNAGLPIGRVPTGPRTSWAERY